MVVSHKAVPGSQKLHGRGTCQQTGAVLQPAVPPKVACALQSALPAPGSCPHLQEDLRGQFTLMYSVHRTVFLQANKGLCSPPCHLHS